MLSLLSTLWLQGEVGVARGLAVQVVEAVRVASVHLLAHLAAVHRLRLQ
jgi:hypothetical protein